MDESRRDLEAQPRPVIRQVVENLVAPEGSCGVGDSRGDLGFLQSLGDIPQGETAEVCCGARTVEGLVHGLRAAVVWYPGVGDVDRHSL